MAVERAASLDGDAHGATRVIETPCEGQYLLFATRLSDVVVSSLDVVTDKVKVRALPFLTYEEPSIWSGKVRDERARTKASRAIVLAPLPNAQNPPDLVHVKTLAFIRL
ncbi:hypothetical protein L1887_48437 [Cichorium endivia]|nr:hypothetical protein L1887_48437 [Cichorium endivia]